MKGWWGVPPRRNREERDRERWERTLESYAAKKFGFGATPLCRFGAIPLCRHWCWGPAQHPAAASSQRPDRVSPADILRARRLIIRLSPSAHIADAGRNTTALWGGTLRQSLGELGSRVSASFMRRDRQFRMGSRNDRVGARMHGQCHLLTKRFGNLLTRYDS